MIEALTWDDAQPDEMREWKNEGITCAFYRRLSDMAHECIRELELSAGSSMVGVERMRVLGGKLEVLRSVIKELEP